MPLKSCYISRRKSTFSFEFVLTLIAEDAAPICFANALPWIAVTVAVFASRIRDALIAKFTFPSPPTPGAFTKRKLIKTLSFVLTFSSFFFFFYSKNLKGGECGKCDDSCVPAISNEKHEKKQGEEVFFSFQLLRDFFFKQFHARRG